MWWGISASLCEVFYMEAAMISASRQQCSVCLCLKHLCDAFISIWTKRKKEATLLNFTVWFTSKFCSLTIQSVCSKVLYHSQFQQSLLDHQAEYGDVICHKNDQWEICTTGIWGFLSSEEENWAVCGWNGTSIAQKEGCGGKPALCAHQSLRN